MVWGGQESFGAGGPVEETVLSGEEFLEGI